MPGFRGSGSPIASEQWRSSGDFGLHGELRSSAVSPQTPFRRCLQLAGAEIPSTWCSFWWIPWLWWRFLVLIATVSIVYNIIWFHNKQPWVTPFYLLPALAANIAAASGWWWLPGLLKALIAEEDFITLEDAKIATRLYSRFTLFWFVLGIGVTVSRAIATESLSITLVVLGLECGSTIILASILLALSIETILAKKEIGQAADAAKKMTLTRQQYDDVVERVSRRSHRWKRPLDGLFLVAVACTFGLVLCHMHFYDEDGNPEVSIFTRHDDDLVSGVEINAEITSVLAKESVLLFILMTLVMNVNDAADSIVTVLIRTAPWGPPGSAKEAERLDLVQRATTYSVTPAALESWYAYVTTPRCHPIRFNMCHLRITGDYVLAASASLFLAMLNGPVRNAISSSVS